MGNFALVQFRIPMDQHTDHTGRLFGTGISRAHSMGTDPSPFAGHPARGRWKRRSSVTVKRALATSSGRIPSFAARIASSNSRVASGSILDHRLRRWLRHEFHGLACFPSLERWQSEEKIKRARPCGLALYVNRDYVFCLLSATNGNRMGAAK